MQQQARGDDAAFVEDLYARYAADPRLVDPSWRAFFDSLHEQSEGEWVAASFPNHAKPVSFEADELELLGTRANAPRTIAYARVRLF